MNISLVRILSALKLVAFCFVLPQLALAGAHDGPGMPKIATTETENLGDGLYKVILALPPLSFTIFDNSSFSAALPGAFLEKTRYAELGTRFQFRTKVNTLEQS